MLGTCLLTLAISSLGTQPTTQPHPVSRMESHWIPLTGRASGGILILAQPMNRNPRWISIETHPGEPAQVVLERLVKAINDHDPFGWGGPHIIRRDAKGEILPDGNWVHVADGSIGPFPGNVGCYIMAGTESGLGIPQPPKSLTCAYLAESNEIVLNWENPPGGYDSIRVLADGFPSGIGRNSGNLTTHRLPTDILEPFRPGADEWARLRGVDFCVIGIRNGVPSNAAAITFKDNGQEELNGLPFSNGVAPNWTAWSTGEPKATGYESRIKPHKATRTNPEPIVTADDGKVAYRRKLPPQMIRGMTDKPFMQVIKTSSPNAVAGIYRKFLGLTPGRTYRLSARLFPLDMPKAQGDWSFSLHAVPCAADRSTLTAEQLAGRSPLPDGQSGPQAGLIALYAPGVSPPKAQPQPATPARKKPASAPADEPVADLVTGDIRLPEGADTITVWLRHQADRSTGVGLDWIRLEEVPGQ